MTVILYSVVITSDVLGDGHYQITLVQTGLDTVDIDVRKWKFGSDYSLAADEDAAHTLTNARFHSGVLTAQTTAYIWFVAKITLKLSGIEQTPSFSVNDKTFPLSVADHAAVETFFAAAKFPLG